METNHRYIEKYLLFIQFGPLQQINFNIYNLFEINNSSNKSRNWWKILNVFPVKTRLSDIEGDLAVS